ncbi:hypothetical protein GUJ93_ZPchr0301g2759 [Zizania palustris]|uniref:Uncharacterized protein n=1 Tax=Zizania palustris TaxID=103762 RepID=A0A8J5RBR8_ZIZPA|nr:hypothetical protein GUJ93_ZPchr0301g2759 [Zizania palustris]
MHALCCCRGHTNPILMRASEQAGAGVGRRRSEQRQGGGHRAIDGASRGKAEGACKLRWPKQGQATSSGGAGRSKAPVGSTKST